MITRPFFILSLHKRYVLYFHFNVSRTAEYVVSSSNAKLYPVKKALRVLHFIVDFSFLNRNAFSFFHIILKNFFSFFSLIDQRFYSLLSIFVFWRTSFLKIFIYNLLFFPFPQFQNMRRTYFCVYFPFQNFPVLFHFL